MYAIERSRFFKGLISIQLLVHNRQTIPPMHNNFLRTIMPNTLHNKTTAQPMLTNLKPVGPTQPPPLVAS